MSLSDRSASTDCVEEFIGDASPFAGLFKGSTMALNVTAANQQTYLNQCTTMQAPMPMTTFGAVQRRAERPTTLFKAPATATATPPATEHAVNGENDEQKPATMTTTTTTTTTTATHLSPFDEQEEWAKISEIMATFGTDAIQDSIFATDEERRRAHQATIARRKKLRQHLSLADGPDSTANIVDAAALVIDQPLTLSVWLESAEVGHVEVVLQRNGFDDVEFLVSCWL